jgi:hypothetical protein
MNKLHLSKGLIGIVVGMFMAGFLCAQDSLRVGEKTAKGVVCYAVFYKGDTIPFTYLEEAVVTGTYLFIDYEQEVRYYKLKRDVSKVYPYAILAAAKLKEYNKAMEKMPKEADRKSFMKKAEKELKEQFEDDLKNLTITQGRILLKLVDRETGTTSYDLVKGLRGSFSAFMWQTVAKMFGSNLKSEYDADGSDKAIERAIREIENGS